MDTLLSSVDEVIEALNGVEATARRYGRGATAVMNWLARQKLPAGLYLVMTADLAAIGKKARPELWGMQVAPKKKAA